MLDDAADREVDDVIEDAGAPDGIQVAEDRVTEAPMRQLAATLDRPRPECRADDEVPPLWHWLYFTPIDLRRNMGADEHTRRGGFMPEVSLPRRMWAGGRLQSIAPLRICDAAQLHSQVAGVQHKSGRSGQMVFVTVEHEIRCGDELRLREAHDIFYREAPASGAHRPPGAMAQVDAKFERTVVPDPVMLFVYLALTFNGHRIHYDRDYCRQVEH